MTDEKPRPTKFQQAATPLASPNLKKRFVPKPPAPPPELLTKRGGGRTTRLVCNYTRNTVTLHCASASIVAAYHDVSFETFIFDAVMIDRWPATPLMATISCAKRVFVKPNTASVVTPSPLSIVQHPLIEGA